MTTEQAIDVDFEEYVRRNLPDILVGDDSAHGEAARQSWIGDARRAWLMRLVQGWTPRELLEGPDFGTETHLDGRPVRRPRSEVSAGLEAQAGEVLTGLRERGITVDSIAEHCLLMALDSPVAKVRWAVSEGLAAIARFDAAKRNERAELTERPMLTVHLAFRAKTKSYAVGRHPICLEEAQDLADWANKMESEAKLRGWPAPNGYEPSTWPPYSIG